MGPELLILGIPVLLLAICGGAALTLRMDETAVEQERESRMVETEGAMPGESLDQLVDLQALASDQPSPVVQEVAIPLEVTGLIDEEHLLIQGLEALGELDLELEDFVVDEDLDVDVVAAGSSFLPASRRELKEQIPLPLPCEVLDPVLV